MISDGETVEGMAILTAREMRRVSHRTTTRIDGSEIEVTVEIEGYEPSECVGMLAALVDDVGSVEA